MNKEIRDALEKERERQYNNIELIASENYTSKSVMDLCGSILTNKYAEGYPSKRYYGGCENVDEIENLAIKYATELFNVKYANVQPHSGSSANMAVYKALLNIGDKILGMDLNSGGHLTHGSPFSFSGKEYEIVSYGVNKDEVIDYDELEKIALSEKPKLIIAGASAYSRKIDFKKFREIADKCGAYLMVDMAHIAGLVAAGYHENPCDYADVVTSTTHKTLRGPRGGFILTNDEEIYKKIQKTVFPGIQGGPLMHIIGGKAEAFYEASLPEFKEYIKQVIKNTKTMSDTFIENGYKVVSNGTDNHLLLLDVTPLTGKEAETILDEINITVNKNMIPFDKNKPNITSGIRIGSAAMTTRGLKEKEFKEIALIICDALKDKDSKDNLKKRVKEIINKCNF